MAVQSAVVRRRGSWLSTWVRQEARRGSTQLRRAVPGKGIPSVAMAAVAAGQKLSSNQSVSGRDRCSRCQGAPQLLALEALHSDQLQLHLRGKGMGRADLQEALLGRRTPSDRWWGLHLRKKPVLKWHA